jgi:hypothetical protein
MAALFFYVAEWLFNQKKGPFPQGGDDPGRSICLETAGNENRFMRMDGNGPKPSKWAAASDHDRTVATSDPDGISWAKVNPSVTGSG